MAIDLNRPSVGAKYFEYLDRVMEVQSRTRPETHSIIVHRYVVRMYDDSIIRIIMMHLEPTEPSRSTPSNQKKKNEGCGSCASPDSEFFSPTRKSSRFLRVIFVMRAGIVSCFFFFFISFRTFPSGPRLCTLIYYNNYYNNRLPKRSSNK
jgi:hypothetical protein